MYSLTPVQCANTGFNPDPEKVSFSCRIAANLRSLPEGERRKCMCHQCSSPLLANLIALLQEYASKIPGFSERVGGDFARGHTEATGGIIKKVSREASTGAVVIKALMLIQDEFELLVDSMGILAAGSSPRKKQEAAKPGQTKGIQAFFKPVVSKPDSH